MKKSELVQLVKDSAGVKYRDRSAAIHIGNSFGSIIGQLFSQDANQFEYYAKRVTLNVENRVATVTLPLIQTSKNANGIVRIMPTGADADCYPDDTEFYPAPAYSLRSSVDANKMSHFVFYVVTGNTVRFNDSLPKEVTSVLADVVPEFQGYDDDDLISLPQGVAQLIIDGAVSAIKGEAAYTQMYKSRTTKK